MGEANYTNDPHVEIDCAACLIRALREKNSDLIVINGDDEIAKRVGRHEAAGLRYCFTCGSWDDDTDCFPGDHSRHCGHELKPLGTATYPDSLASDYRLICTAKVKLAALVPEEAL